ncbi:type IV toxin-antitoxin system AbiEi family antitoxin domain-containing protein [Ruania zhangjianzhongii]|uniref:type IV toxin-antitoxin system AbiEi family antitoxin domain-containing protein n=1 Tax=Ruania zhangjianzhongii TaxID=2603206 RepID=UPI0011C978BD|nr:type IV toxin-antitoxin system AbiEi family antitoxin domain-containing protein [Ruania zhangjianzhongii]
MPALPFDTHGLVTSADATRAGMRAVLQGMVASGKLERLWPGVYRRPLSIGTPAERAAEAYRARVLAAARRLRRPVFASYSAAALLGLPIIGTWPDEIFILSGRATGSRQGRLVRLATRCDPPLMENGDLRITSVAYTLIQLARQARLGAAVVAADAALRDLPYGPKAAPLTTLTELMAMHQRLLPYPRSNRVQAMLDRATHLSASALESVSRLAIEELGLATPQLQVRLHLDAPHGDVYLDFGWEQDIGGESDGDSKYLAPDNTVATAARLLAEKEREDAMRAKLRGLARWGWRDAWQGSPLRRKLLQVGVPQVRSSVARFW